ncbi:hypothetical protein Slala05_53080 [Streptomyces lavendulae subsp. lavendulae]|nr:hypothetical protein Slala05_53080 [Streptomyces lavendulae subsp. lavendulae]
MRNRRRHSASSSRYGRGGGGAVTGRARTRTRASSSTTTAATRYGARQPSRSPSVPLNVRASSIPPIDPLSSVPITAPRRSGAAIPAASGAISWAATVVTPTHAEAATRAGRAGAHPAARRPSPESRSRVTMKGRYGIRSPSGTSRRIPAV